MKWKYFNPKFEYEEKFQDIAWPWAGHKYFAYDLIRNKRPERVVELGTFRGTSLFSFAQAIKDENLNTELCGIDTWQGDEHSGFYGDDIYNGVQGIRKEFYKKQEIKLIRKTFDEAINEFSDKTIDILHIDGLHTYDAVKHDFENWFSKVKDDGIILFHDIMVTRDDFGVYKFWSEIKNEFKVMEFEYSYGLGVLFKNADDLILSHKDELELRYSYFLEDVENLKIAKLKEDIDILKADMKEKEDVLKSKDEKILQLEAKLNKIKNLLVWKILHYFYKLYKNNIKKIVRN